LDWLSEKAFPRVTAEGDERKLVPGELFDCMPANFLVNKQKQLFLIDQEWESKAPLELGFVFFRGVYRELSANLEFFEQTDLFVGGTFYDVLAACYNEFDLFFDQEVFDHYLDIEITFQLEVGTYNVGRKGLTDYLHTFFNEARTRKTGFAELLISGGTRQYALLIEREKMLNQAVAEGAAQLSALNQRMVERDVELSEIYQSHSWRLTAPLRFMGYLVRGDFDKIALAGETIRQWITTTPKRFLRWLLIGVNRITETETDSTANHPALCAIIEERCNVTREQPLADLLSAVTPDVLPSVDISVVTFNSQKWIPGFVESLLLLEYPKSLLTVCFVDNDSTDSTVATLQAEASKLTAVGYTVDILKQKNRGYGAGHNAAIKKGTAPFCLVSNIDLVFEPEALKRVVSTAVADDARGSAWELRQKPYEHPKFYDPVTGTTNWNSHACVLLRRRALEKVGGYDETLFMYGEDVELSYRLRRSGALLRYCPHAVVQHFCYEQAEQIKPLQHSGSTFANLYLRLKYGNFKDIRAVPFLATQLLLMREPYPGARRSIIRSLIRLVSVAPKALLSRKKVDGLIFFPFYTWDYEMVREGAFVEQADLPADRPLVTIITRTFKGRELYLRQALLSVAHQSYPNIEHIIIEDGSDSLQPVVEHFGQLTGSSAVYLSIDKRGRSAAGNKGLDNSRGQWCLFLDDDDLLFAEHVELLVSTLTKKRAAVAAYSLAWEVFTDETGILDGKYTENKYLTPSFLGEEYDYKTLEHHNYMAIQSVLFERQLFEERGGFDADLDTLEDWVMWLCYGYGNQFIYVPKVTSMFRTPFGQTVRENRQSVIDSGYEDALERARSRINALGLDKA
jgi:glycosyltransferase involved in cell wall biosynthesis